MAFGFNLCSNAFIIYSFTDIDQFVAGQWNQSVIDTYKSYQPKTLTVMHTHNDLKMLMAYNRHVVHQCHERVYCAANTGIRL